MKMKSKERQREKIMLAAAAFLLILSLMSGSVLAGFLAQMTGSEGNDIDLFGGNSPGLTVSQISAGAARKLGFDAIGDEETTVWKSQTRVDIFRLEYDRSTGNITVRSGNGDKVIAPGTANDYGFTFTNRRNEEVEYLMWVEAKVEPEDLELPIHVKMQGPDGKWLLGSADEWKQPLELDGIEDSGHLWRRQSSAYKISWEWPFEQGDDLRDTELGNRVMDEPLTYTIVINSLATRINNDGNTNEDNRKPTGSGETTASETTASGTKESETTAANESSGSGENNGSDGNGAETSAADGTNRKPSKNDEHGYVKGRTDGEDESGSQYNNGETSESGWNQNGNDDKNGTKETIADDNNRGNDSAETGNDNAGFGFKFPWGILLLPILIPFLLRRHIYVTGFLAEEAGMDLFLKRKKDTIRPNGRFVFPRVTYGKHTFALCNADGEEKSWFDWAVKRDKDVEGIVFEKDDDGRTVIRVGKKIRAIEIWLDVKNEDMEVRKLRWAAIDKDHNVYTPTGMTEPKDDKTNITPDGLKVDEHGQYSF